MRLEYLLVVLTQNGGSLSLFLLLASKINLTFLYIEIDLHVIPPAFIGILEKPLPNEAYYFDEI